MGRLKQGDPMLMLCLPGLRDLDAVLGDDGFEDQHYFHPDKFDISISRPSGGVTMNAGRLGYHLYGPMMDLDGEIHDMLACTGSVPIVKMLQAVTAVTYDRSRALPHARDNDAEEGAEPSINDRLSPGLRRRHDDDGTGGDCLDQDCGCIESCRDDCDHAERFRQPTDSRHYHFRIIPWGAWGSSDSLFFHNIGFPPVIIGDRLIEIDSVSSEHSKFCSDGSIQVSEAYLHLYDYNLQSPLNSSPSLLRPVGSNSPDQAHTTVQTIVPCPLTQPIPPPCFTSEVEKRLQDFAYGNQAFEEVFDEEVYTGPRSMQLHSSRSMQLDPTLSIKGIFCDGENLVIAMVCALMVLSYYS
jgi:hypothetical protein